MDASSSKLFGYMILTLFIVSPAWSDAPGNHPFYLHALADLRDARAHLEHVSSDPVDHAEAHAIQKIDEAIREIKRAAIDDGKDIRDHVPVDAHLQRTDRFHKAIELLDKARADVSRPEEQVDTRELRERVLRHIEEARSDVRRIIEKVLNRG